MIDTSRLLSANMCAFITNASACTTSFDTDSVPLILDTGATAVFTFCMQDFITFKVLNSKVSGLGTLKILDIGTIQYKIMTDNNRLEMLTIENAYYLPALKTRLVSPQQWCVQFPGATYSGDSKSFSLHWKSFHKSVPYNSRNNLPILYTAPGLDNGISLYSAMTSDQLSTFSLNKHCVPIHVQAPSQNTLAANNVTINCSSTHCGDCNFKLHAFNSIETGMTKISSMTNDQKDFLDIHVKSGHLSFSTLMKHAKKGLIPSKFALSRLIHVFLVY